MTERGEEGGGRIYRRAGGSIVRGGGGTEIEKRRG